MIVELMNFDRLVVVLEDGKVLPMTDFFDTSGCECDPLDAVVVIAGSNEFGWLTIEVSETVPRRLH